MPPREPIPSASRNIGALPVSTANVSDCAGMYDANNWRSPELSLMPTTFGCCAKSATSDAGSAKCMYLGML